MAGNGLRHLFNPYDWVLVSRRRWHKKEELASDICWSVQGCEIVKKREKRH